MAATPRDLEEENGEENGEQDLLNGVGTLDAGVAARFVQLLMHRLRGDPENHQAFDMGDCGDGILGDAPPVAGRPLP
jgi:hypothetical protein